MAMKNRKIRIAVQNKGRLMEPSLSYLRQCGLKFTPNDRSLIVECENFPIEILFVRNSDIPQYIKYNVADFGIIGKNLLLENNEKYEIIKPLNFGICSLVIAAPGNSKIASLRDLEDERIATSYPNTLRNILKSRKINASIIEIQGSVEICPALDLSDAIFDITQTGKTLEENGLKIIEKLFESQAVLIKNLNSNPQYEGLFV